ncbi:transposable element Tcb1 transposase [Trichonephila clavipes]|uniref:Transposable element Tcb1 transposase n=1 Tax=Trichonephila clavipes TaxID=2585209 RepID=A0A8X6SH01_TRICX|nr:transposable element Tcb1 transposase [Trichonephila clavipes]
MAILTSLWKDVGTSGQERGLLHSDGSGYSRQNNSREYCYIIRHVRRAPNVSLSTIHTQAASSLRASVSICTIARCLVEGQLQSQRSTHVLSLIPTHHPLNLEWCCARRNWIATEWNQVIFSNESRFKLHIVDNCVHASSIRRRLLHRGLRARVPLYKIPLTANHRRLQLQWAHEHRAWQADWYQVVFSDESRFNFGDHDDRIRVRRSAGERCLPECVIERHSGLTPEVMHFTCAPEVSVSHEPSSIEDLTKEDALRSFDLIKMESSCICPDWSGIR